MHRDLIETRRSTQVTDRLAGRCMTSLRALAGNVNGRLGPAVAHARRSQTKILKRKDSQDHH
jgi:hypothetical protein